MPLDGSNGPSGFRKVGKRQQSVIRQQEVPSFLSMVRAKLEEERLKSERAVLRKKRITQHEAPLYMHAIKETLSEYEQQTLKRQNTIVQSDTGEASLPPHCDESPDFLDIMERKIAEKACEVMPSLKSTHDEVEDEEDEGIEAEQDEPTIIKESVYAKVILETLKEYERVKKEENLTKKVVSSFGFQMRENGGGSNSPNFLTLLEQKLLEQKLIDSNVAGPMSNDESIGGLIIKGAILENRNRAECSPQPTETMTTNSAAEEKHPYHIDRPFWDAGNKKDDEMPVTNDTNSLKDISRDQGGSKFIKDNEGNTPAAKLRVTRSRVITVQSIVREKTNEDMAPRKSTVDVSSNPGKSKKEEADERKDEEVIQQKQEVLQQEQQRLEKNKQQDHLHQQQLDIDEEQHLRNQDNQDDDLEFTKKYLSPALSAPYPHKKSETETTDDPRSHTLPQKPKRTTASDNSSLTIDRSHLTSPLPSPDYSPPASPLYGKVSPKPSNKNRMNSRNNSTDSSNIDSNRGGAEAAHHLQQHTNDIYAVVDEPPPPLPPRGSDISFPLNRFPKSDPKRHEQSHKSQGNNAATNQMQKRKTGADSPRSLSPKSLSPKLPPRSASPRPSSPVPTSRESHFSQPNEVSSSDKSMRSEPTHDLRSLEKLQVKIQPDKKQPDSPKLQQITLVHKHPQQQRKEQQKPQETPAGTSHAPVPDRTKKPTNKKHFH